MDYLIKRGVVLPETREKDFCVVEGKVCKSIDKLREGQYKVLDLEGRLVLRGFADVHMHLDKAYLNNGEQTAANLEDAIRLTHIYKKRADERDVYRRARRMAEECFRQGTRWIRTHVDVDTYWGLTAWNALKQLREDMKPRLVIQLVAFPQEGIADNRENDALLEEAVKSGADLIGGIPATERDGAAHIHRIMDLAEAYDKDVDMHVDETDDGGVLTIRDLIQETVKRGWQDRVTAGHLCSLSANPPEKRKGLLSQIKQAGIRLVALPSTNLYLQGKADTVNTRRGILPAGEALEAGILVAAASDNTQDFFNPFGRGNALDQAYLMANCCYMGTREQMWEAFKMVTAYPAEIMGAAPWVREGDLADFIILDARSVSEAIINRRPLFGYFENGKLKEGEGRRTTDDRF